MKRHTFSRRQFIQTSALALPLIVGGCGLGNLSRQSRSAGDFVRVRDGRFELNGKPYRYIGANLWYGCYLSDA
ncbi:MAG TPA: mannanase, partial [Candidatus Paceibacterota bacterium]|nr:mannanase [Candidatus Paceibacterota bacterium]